MDSKLAIGVGVAAVGGILIGTLMGGSGPDLDEIKDIVSAEVAAASEQTAALDGKISDLQTALDGQLAGVSEAMDGKVAAVSDAVAALGDKLGAVEASIAGSDAAAQIDALKTQIEQVAANLGSAMTESAANQAAALEERLTALQASLAASSTTAPAPSATAPVATPAASAAATPSDGLSPGMTAMLAGGDLRVFVSRVTEDAARLSIAGDMVDLGVGDDVLTMAGKDYCKVLLDAVANGHAIIKATCGDDLPLPEGLSAGNTFSFNDGAIRAFVSKVDADGARLSVNGSMVSLDEGRTTLVKLGEETCGLRLDSVDRGHASVSAICGDALGVAAHIAPGSAVMLGDGAARVFLSSVSDAGDMVRVAVNGTGVKALEIGDALAVNDSCMVTVEDITDGQASFGYSCDG